MIRRINKFLFLLIVIGICLYLVVLNPSPFTIALTPSRTYSIPAGIILITTFFAGMILAGAIGLWLGIRSYIRERRYINERREREIFFKDFMEARDRSASDALKAAQDRWEKIISRHRDTPPAAIARIELARTFERTGDKKNALRLLDEARTILPDNVEVLFEAAALQEALGNRTAAIDNLALVMYHFPNAKAARRLRELSLAIGRFEDALEYNQQLARLGSNGDDCQSFERSVRLRQLMVSSGSVPAAELKQSLTAFTKRNGDSKEALCMLSKMAEDDGKIDEAAQLLVKAAKVSKSLLTSHEAVKLWLRHDRPERALGVARSTYNEATGLAKVIAATDLARLHLALHMPSDALQILQEASQIFNGEAQKAEGEDASLKQAVSADLAVLKGVSLTRLEKEVDANTVWDQLAKYDCPSHTKMLAGIEPR